MTSSHAGKCKGNAGFRFDKLEFSNPTYFPKDYGNTCKAWEKDHCADMWPADDEPGTWCCEEWQGTLSPWII